VRWFLDWAFLQLANSSPKKRTIAQHPQEKQPPLLLRSSEGFRTPSPKRKPSFDIKQSTTVSKPLFVSTEEKESKVVTPSNIKKTCCQLAYTVTGQRKVRSTSHSPSKVKMTSLSLAAVPELSNCEKIEFLDSRKIQTVDNIVPSLSLFVPSGEENGVDGDGAIPNSPLSSNSGDGPFSSSSSCEDSIVSSYCSSTESVIIGGILI